MFHEYDVVVLAEDLPNENLLAGATGTILMVYGEGTAYEVEFLGEDVYESILAMLKPEQIQFVWSEGMGLRRG